MRLFCVVLIMDVLVKSVEYMITLFKGLVIAEGFYRDTCGSTTVKAHIYREIRKSQLDQGHVLANFAFTYALNKCNSFGAIGNGRCQGS